MHQCISMYDMSSFCTIRHQCLTIQDTSDRTLLSLIYESHVRPTSFEEVDLIRLMRPFQYRPKTRKWILQFGPKVLGPFVSGTFEATSVIWLVCLQSNLILILEKGLYHFEAHRCDFVLAQGLEHDPYIFSTWLAIIGINLRLAVNTFWCQG